MKKILSIVMAIAMVFSVCMLFSSCQGSTPDNETESVSDESNSGAAAEQNATATVTAGKLTMATNANFPPYEYKEGEEFRGIDVEIAGLIAEKLGLELEIVNIEFGAIIAGVQTGKYDMGMAGMTVTEERLASVDFSDTYATGVQVIIVPEDSPIASADDIASDGSMKIGVQQDTTGDIYCSDDFGSENVNKYPNGADAVQDLLTGRIDCVIIDNEPAKAFVEQNTGLKILDSEYVTEDYAICFAKENTALKDAVNTALKELIADGSVQTIIDKYITAE